MTYEQILRWRAHANIDPQMMLSWGWPERHDGMHPCLQCQEGKRVSVEKGEPVLIDCPACRGFGYRAVD